MSIPTKFTEELVKKFLLIGLITSIDFQKCRYVLTKLNQYYPKKYKNQIRPMLDVEWCECILKLRRESGSGSPLWQNSSDLIIFCDGKFFGDYRALQEYIKKRYRFIFKENWECAVNKHLTEYFMDITQKFRQLVYFTIALEDEIIGTLLFELYCDLVPLTCKNFLYRCISDDDDENYFGVPIHRSVVPSWIQFGGFNLPESDMPDENFVIPHDRRGILGMCNRKKHTNNTTQFYITLGATPWMDYKYVAFGLLLQGEDVLKKIERVPTFYQDPQWKMRIVRLGEYSPNWRPEKLNSITEIKNRVEAIRVSIPTSSLDRLDIEAVVQKPQLESFDQKTYSESSRSTVSLLGGKEIKSASDRESSVHSYMSLPAYLAQLAEGGGEGGHAATQGYIPGGYGYEPEKSGGYGQETEKYKPAEFEFETTKYDKYFDGVGE